MINQQLAEKLKILANHMLEVADEMWHYDIGDSAIDDLILQHSTDLEGASKMVRDWSNSIEFNGLKSEFGFDQLTPTCKGLK